VWEDGGVGGASMGRSRWRVAPSLGLGEVEKGWTSLRHQGGRVRPLAGATEEGARERGVAAGAQRGHWR
jgi:hypothetical protein